MSAFPSQAEIVIAAHARAEQSANLFQSGCRTVILEVSYPLIRRAPLSHRDGPTRGERTDDLNFSADAHHLATFGQQHGMARSLAQFNQ